MFILEVPDCSARIGYNEMSSGLILVFAFRSHGLETLGRSYKKASVLSEMPRACPVEFHVCSYKNVRRVLRMPRPCAVEAHVRG